MNGYANTILLYKTAHFAKNCRFKRRKLTVNNCFNAELSIVVGGCHSRPHLQKTMKQFTFYYLKLNGENAVETITASNQGKAISIFRNRKDVAKILNIAKEKNKRACK